MHISFLDLALCTYSQDTLCNTVHKPFHFAGRSYVFAVCSSLSLNIILIDYSEQSDQSPVAMWMRALLTTDSFQVVVLIT